MRERHGTLLQTEVATYNFTPEFSDQLAIACQTEILY